MIKENYIYVGIDLHKETHTAVMIDCYNNKLGEITFPNRPADFPKLVTKVKKCNTDAKEVVYGLENAYGYGRPLAVWLIDKGYFVKDVNTAISHRQAKHRGAMYHKSDSDDAGAIAGDKVKNNAYQDARDMVTLSIVSDLQYYDKQLAEVDKMLEQMYKMLGCTLTTIPGVNVITAVKILAEIGDIKRFSNANKLAQFAGIAPLHLSSSGKGKDVATKQGNR